MSNITMNILKKDFRPLCVYLHTACADYKQEALNCQHGYEFYQILFVVEGEGVLKCNNKTYELKRGCAFFTAPYIPMSYCGNDGFVTAFLTVYGSGIDLLAKHFDCDGFLFYPFVDIEKYLADINVIINEYYTYKRQSVLSALAYSLYVDFFEHKGQQLSLIKKVALYIEKNFTKKLTLTKIADNFGISVSKLSHDFKNEFNCTVFEYILNLRLTYARNFLLSNPKSKTKDAALFCGFDDISYFCKAYKLKFGTKPSSDKRELGG